MIVTDWLWVARQRAQGKDYRFILIQRRLKPDCENDSPIKTRRFERIQGWDREGPLDKSWLILRAYAMQEHGMDLKGDKNKFWRPPMMKAALTGETYAADQFLALLSQDESQGNAVCDSVDDAALALDLIRIRCWLCCRGAAADKPRDCGGFGQCQPCKGVLGADEAAWEHLKGRMKPKSDAEFTALIEGFRAEFPLLIQLILMQQIAC